MRRELVAVLILCLALPGLLGSCGKKGPPFLPEQKMLLGVRQLQGSWDDQAIVLRGQVAALQGARLDPADIAGCRIYRARYPLNNPPCEACPITYRVYTEITGPVVTAEGFFCRVEGIRKPGIHFLQVRLVGPKGALGPLSNRIRMSSRK